MGERSSLDEDAHRLVEDGRHLAALAAEVVPNRVWEDTRRLGAKGLGSEEEDKHYADPATLVEEDMDELLLDPDIGLVSLDLVEDKGSGRPWAQEDALEAIVGSNSHLGWGRPEGDIEDVEVP